ncbi:uncharacterized protein LOC100205276 isoform X2 [Hydra vulgaris]|uniref:uncharacterized protein LOC100205276 isoform X2 n=1 Tax=Hydra vulgaris TaxID=6087 RepID=UPI001F5F65F4|nr:uncharacterized protein LOC100205276 isoform X2 [Hydra vulgaris]
MKIIIFLVLSSLLKDAESFSFDQCGVSVNCLTLPLGCTSFTSCNAVAQYYYNNVTSRLEIQLSSINKWVGFGQVLGTAPTDMTNLYGAYCILGNDGVPKFGLFKSFTTGSVSYINTSNVAYVTLLQATVNGSYFTCSYSRPLDVGMYADSLLPLNDTQYIAALAYGNSLTSDGLLTYHDNELSTDYTINWTMNGNPASGTPTPSNPASASTTPNNSASVTPTPSNPASATPTPSNPTSATQKPSSSGFFIKASITLAFTSLFVFLFI